LNVFTFAASFLDEKMAARRAFIEKLDDIEKKRLADTRDSLLTSLQENDVNAVARYIGILTDSA
jgi:hypothetical protein